MSASIFTFLPLALAPVPEIGFVLQAGAAGTAVGTVVAARARRRRPDVDAARITAAWTMLGLVGGLVTAAVSLLLG